ncbi:hypothetical protein ACLMPP_00735 [Yersinia enterocolitica]|uniref:hypothetical protein n=1 Tax=Yersinia enterocolitica TaxID=630 RepID=UPI00398CA6F0
MITVLDFAYDNVIDSVTANSKTSYQYALEKFHPLVDRFLAQRKIQEQKFYKRLKRDILKGCLMPAITIAFVKNDVSEGLSQEDIQIFINENIDKGYILDGLQRLTTLLSVKDDDDFNAAGVMYVNVIIAPSQDKLLYRMITLNNGQRPMTPRHQIEILTKELFDFSDLTIKIQTEKERAESPIKGSFDLSDISKGYLAFLTRTVNNDNNKIIDEKMDQILVSRILDTDIKNSTIQFVDIIKLIDRLCFNEKIKKWFQVNNNLIGFCVGIISSYQYINRVDISEFESSINLFEEGFSSINASKVNLGKFRRLLSMEFISNYNLLSINDGDELSEYFMEYTAK